MLIEAGFDIAFECPAQTPMILQLRIHPSPDVDLRHGLLLGSAHRLRVAAAVRACGLWRRGVFPPTPAWRPGSKREGGSGDRENREEPLEADRLDNLKPGQNDPRVGERR